jgi:hypothetical protein
MLNSLSIKICYLAFGLPIPVYLHYFIPVFLLFRSIKKVIRIHLVCILIILIPLFVYLIRLVRNDFFFLSDDFAHLWWSYSHSYLETARIALLGSGIWVGHRIVLGFWLFKAIFNLFGTDIRAYVLVIFLLNAINTLLLYKILRRINKSLFAVLVAFVFATNYVWWISNIHELLAGIFVLLLVLFWMSWVSKAKRKDLFISSIFYILALLTKEITFLVYPILLLTLIYLVNQNKKLYIEKAKRSWPLAAIFIAYSIFYASSFLSYFGLPKGGGYVMSFDPQVIIGNLSHYLSLVFPVFNESWLGVVSVFVLFIVVDVRKRKIYSLPFLLSYLLFLGPALLFESRQAPYYNYIGSFFLFVGVMLVLIEIYQFILYALKRLQVPKIWFRIGTIYYLLIILIGVFQVNNFFMDNCFLIQYPWENSKRVVVQRITSQIDKLIREGRLDYGTTVILTDEENTEEAKFIIGSGVLQLFLTSPNARNYYFELHDSELKVVKSPV